MTNVELVIRAAHKADIKIQKIIKLHGDCDGKRLLLDYFMQVFEEERKSMVLAQECCRIFSLAKECAGAGIEGEELE